MKLLAALLILAASLQPYVVCDSAAAAAAAASGKGSAAAAAAAAASGGRGGSAAAAAAAAGGGAAAAAAAAAYDDPEITNKVVCRCPQKYEPVCGTDGNTYSNKCILDCISRDNVHHGWPPIKLHHKGHCTPPPCVCPAVYAPVCGTNNHTYGNECQLACENARRKKVGYPLIKIAYRKACSKPHCSCTDDIIPVCGTDGKTYRNVCGMQCVSRIRVAHGLPAIHVKSHGACEPERCPGCKAKPALPACGNNDKTYRNPCMLKCENRRRDQLGLPLIKVAYKGPCIRCKCTKHYKPVCASNNYTYDNICLLDCENRIRKAKNLPPLTVVYNDECGCRCSKKWEPVCASNYRTYRNQCALRCVNLHRKHYGLKPLYIQHNGECICDCKYCSTRKNEVCGSDHVTYWNRCWLLCYSNCNVKAGYKPIKKVKNGKC